jgi:hypothetical protein
MYNTFCLFFFFFIWEHQTKTSDCNFVLEQAREDLYPMYEYEIPHYETNDKIIDLDVSLHKCDRYEQFSSFHGKYSIFMTALVFSASLTNLDLMSM